METREGPITKPPAEGLCRVCEQTTRVRSNGLLYKHPKFAYTVTSAITAEDNNCTGSGQLPSIVLEMTFARWLHAHRTRRDFRTNDITLLAQYAFGERNSCAPLRTPADVSWTTAEAFHVHIHTRPTGVGPEKISCDWRCRMIDKVSISYQTYQTTNQATEGETA
jgi:hypothetical protein